MNKGDWKLKVSGLVERPLSFSYEELLNLPVVEKIVTIQCIGNKVGGGLIGNALWKGVRLKDILEMAGVKRGVREVVFHAVDGYAESLPLDYALREEVFLAYEMNGKPLPSKHGAPVRLIIPNRYGLKHVKWLSAVELVDRDFQGYWVKRGWDKEAGLKTMSRIDYPTDRAHLPLSPINIEGIAFSGNGISKVEISLRGKNWEKANLRPPLSPYSWVLWSFYWQPPAAGEYKLKVRAIDGRGGLQIEEPAEPAPSGATGYHSITLFIE